MLKLKLDATSFASLPDDLKKEYQLTTDGSYKLDLGPDVFTTDKDPQALFNALENERAELKRVRAIADKFEEERKQTEADSITSIEELKSHFQKQVDDQRKLFEKEKRDAEKRLEAQRQASADQAARSEALKVATEIFGDKAAIMLPHVQNMIKGKINETGSSTVEFLDPVTGAPLLDQNFEKFREAVSTNPLFKSMVVVSKASGGSANDGNNTGLATTKDDGSPKKYNDFSSGELVRLKRDQPEKFQQLLDSRTS